MPRTKKSTQVTQVQENAGTQKIQMIKYNELMSILSSKCRYLSQLMTIPGKMHQAMLQHLWQQKINDRLLKYPHIPGTKLFNKISSECWNQVYQLYQENQAHFARSDMNDDGLEIQIRKISAEIKEIEQKNHTNYSLS